MLNDFFVKFSQKFKVYLLDIIFVFASTLVIAIATLSPFNFHYYGGFNLTYFLASFNNSSSFQDQLNNVLLFMPLGFCCASLLQKLRIKLGLQVVILLIFSAGLSLTVETLQIFLPSRSPTPADIINNTLGGCLGLLSCYIWNYQFLNNSVSQFKSSSSKLSNQRITLFILSYVSLILIISIFWQSTTHLRNWNLNFPLVLGNETVGNRPWLGYMSNVYITDQALSTYEVKQGLSNANYLANLADSLVANYQFNGSCCYQDQSGNLPDLRWNQKPQVLNADKGVFINSRQWLKTALPVKALSQRISKNSEFTIITTLATENIQQTGPARIISISGNVLQRNLTISQHKQFLELRLRTPLTGENGSDLEIKIPDVFQDTELHRIIITYANGTIQVYIDKAQRFYSLNLLALIPFNQKIFYYALTFIPLGTGLAILNLYTQNRIRFSRVFVPIAVLLPSTFLEIILIRESHKSLSWTSLFLGIFFTSVTMLFFMIRGRCLNARS